MNPITFLNAIPLDKYIHALGSVVVFAVLHYFGATPLVAFSVANAAHVAKKAYDYQVKGSRDWNDLIGDVLAGAIGAALAWACILVR